jgi:16S rRNA G1207 methylase RsmC
MQKSKFRSPSALLPKVLEKVKLFVSPDEYPVYIDIPGKDNSNKLGKGPAIILQNRNRPKSYLLNLIAQTLGRLDMDSRIILISHKNWGAKSLVKIFGDQGFSTKIDTIFTGFEGFRIIEIIKTIEDVTYEYQSKYRFKEEIKNKFSGIKEFEFVTNDQLFSYKHLDEGTKTLIENTKFEKVKTIIDLGCGWGGIGIFAHLINPTAKITMIDDDENARKMSLENAQRTGKKEQFVVTTVDKIVGKKFDLIVSYPPFHISNINVNQMVKELKDLTHKGTRVVFCTDNTFLSKYQLALEAVFEKEAKVEKIGKFNLISLTC